MKSYAKGMKNKQIYLYVDGYNIINAWPNLYKLSNDVDLDSAREELIDIMKEYQNLSGEQVYVVFDAYLVKGGMSIEEKRDNLTVVYTKEHESADRYIERKVNDMKKHDKMYVASNDGMIQRIILSRGGIRISANELWKNYLTLKENLRRSKLRIRKQSTENIVTIDDEIYQQLEKLQDEIKKQN